MADFLPLQVTNFDQNASTQRGLQNDYLKTIMPLMGQEAQMTATLKQQQFQHDQLANAASEVQSLDPDQRSAAWDQKMTELSNSGVPQARQYIGRYTDDRAQSVHSIFSGQSGANAAKAQQDKLANNPQIGQAVSQMDPATRQKALANINQAIEGFNRVNNADDLKAELKLLNDAGINTGAALQGMNLDDPKAFSQNYNRISSYLQQLAPYRDAMMQADTASQLGLNIPAAPHKYMNTGNGGVFDETLGKAVTEPRGQYEFLGPDKTGGAPGYFNKNNPKDAGPLVGPDNYGDFADKFIQSESGGNGTAQSQTSSATGAGQFVKDTWLSMARKAVPGLANMPDQQLLAMRNLPGFSRDMTIALAKDNAPILEKNGQPVNMTTLAMAGKLGAPDAMKVLQANPGTPLDKILSPEVMKANPQLNGQTAGGYAAALTKQFGTGPVGQQSPFGNGPQEAGLQEPDPQAKEILGQTGLNYNTFLTLTGDMSKLARDKATRNAATQEANEFAKKRGVDVATFQSQFKANNEVLQKNIARYSNTKIMEDELLGTIQNLKPAADDATIGNINAANAAAVWAGKETNGPVSNEYAFYLLQLKNELAGYNAALAGRTGSNILQEDYNEAEKVIKNGLNSQGAAGLEKAVTNSTAKMRPVMERSIDHSRQAVWDLFGVGKNYNPIYPNSAGGGAFANTGAGGGGGAYNTGGGQTPFPNAPKVGTVKGGYSYIGGDPSKQASWKKQ